MFKTIIYIATLSLVSAQLPSGIQQVTVTPQADFCKQSGVGEAAGQQQQSGRMCASTVQGLLPDVNKMVSSMISQPASGATVDAAQGFDIVFKTQNLQTGFVADLEKQYLLIPQTVDPNTGFIQGHAQVSIQKIPNAQEAVPASSVEFFQVLDTKPGANGLTTFKVNVPAGAIKTNGVHRICTVSATASGQQVLMPVAQRGAQDDCIRVTVNNATGQKRRR
ncbi:hypothetical protein HK103_005726 [Boothiomyces macroporosus]|uniref:Uncharacterized protein n=1 Tax=Boothiomyces macroporosus TaxID=261099 RepID=A0AAD5UEQ1_9FUNG|nr:hypothetical protein HK103_005726 [Boothiomyces macroporosus]